MRVSVDNHSLEEDFWLRESFMFSASKFLLAEDVRKATIGLQVSDLKLITIHNYQIDVLDECLNRQLVA